MNTLPHSPTRIVGRERELDEIGALLTRAETRLVTLTGPGGIGKTCLALGVAEAALPEFSDGAAFVSLAAVRDPSLTMPEIARAIVATEQAGEDPLALLTAALADLRFLLVLDNLERVTESAVEISRLLAACPGVTVLATSRARLNLRGEHEVAVKPLPLPKPSAGAEEIAKNPAITLFVDRAREARRDFALTAANSATIAEIVRRLDGLPLAIELAAARLRVLLPAALLERLDRRLPVLTGGARDLPDRLQTMRSAIASSYDLLNKEQREVFRRVCIFSGGFTLHEAESVLETGMRVDGQASTVDDGDAQPLIDMLAGVVDNSLIRQVEEDFEPRFQLLETLREFGLERLAESGEIEAMRERHAEFFVSFAEAASPRLRGPERTLWLDRLSRSHDNLRAALTWLCEQQDSARAVRLAGALWQFWWWRAFIGEGRQWLESVATLPGADAQGVAWARLLTGRGALAETQGNYQAASSYHEQAVAAWEALDDARGLATSLLFRWLVAFNAEDQERMSALSSESLRLFRQADDPWGVAMSLMEQGVHAMRRSDHMAAYDVLGEAIDGFTKIGDRWGVAISQGVLGNVASEKRDYVEAAHLLSESLTSLLILNDLWGVATVMPAVSRMAAEQGAMEHAARVSGSIQRLHETLGVPLKVPFRERYERNLRLAERELGSERFATAFAEGRGFSPTEAVQAALAPLASTPSVAAEKKIDPLYLTLSPREREVFRMMPGRTAKEISQELFIGISTANSHIKSIYAKLGFHSYKELISYGYENDLF